MKIKIMPLLCKDGNKVAHAALEFDDFPGYQLQGFTICDDEQKGGLFVLFPATRNKNKETGEMKTWYFLRPTTDNKDKAIGDLEQQILDSYESMMGFNKPRLTEVNKK